MARKGHGLELRAWGSGLGTEGACVCGSTRRSSAVRRASARAPTTCARRTACGLSSPGSRYTPHLLSDSA
eukprot:2491273-Rhodomonas_salina.4